MRVRTENGVYAYPDVVVGCGPSHMEDNRQDTLLNPAVIVEVLSPSTSAYDRGEKFANYRTISSLREYVLVSQDTCRIEHYIRQPDHSWTLTEVINVTDTLTLPTIHCELPLSIVYNNTRVKQSEHARWNGGTS